MRDQRSGVAILGLALAIVALLGIILSGLGSRWGWWHFRIGIAFLRWAFYIGCAALVISAVGVFWVGTARRKALSWAICGLVLGGLAVGFPVNAYRKARSAPPIHDISTDTEDPPQLATILPLRSSTDNPPQYGGPEVSAQQKQAYPDIAPAHLDLPPAQAFERALAAARDMGWRVFAEDPAAGRIEATAITLLFGFKDDVVVRIRPEQNGSRVDARSVSRVGRGDLGTNAQRVRDFIAALKRPQ